MDASPGQTSDSTLPSKRNPKHRGLLWRLGPGLIAGGSDDDPTSIGTYTQAGAAMGYGLLWMLWVTLPLVAVIQEICARIGRITGRGIAGNLRRHYSPWIVYPIVLLLVLANVITLGADVEAMGHAAALLIPGPPIAYSAGLAAIILLLQFLGSYKKITQIFKLLTLTLLSYIAVTFVVHVNWFDIVKGTFIPHLGRGHAYWSTFVAVLGTTISPYLFFWQTSLETEEIATRREELPLKDAPQQAKRALERIRFDTWVGMGFCNVVSFFIMCAAAATFHAHGNDHVSSLAHAASALEPMAGKAAAFLFAAGIIGTGLLAVPALSGSAAFAVGETFRWPTGMHRAPMRAKGFYVTITIVTILGLILGLPAFQHATGLSPIEALFWAAVFNGITAAPIMVMVMLMSRNQTLLGGIPPISRWLQTFGWIATAAMAVSAAMMFIA